LWLVALAVLATLVVGCLEIRHNLISFDGGMNAQVAQNLINQGRYATSYRELVDFDHRVQTGPTVLLPVAVCFRLLGVSSFTAQLPNLVYLALLMGLVVCYAVRHAGVAGGVLAFVVILATPGLYDFGLRLYGEVPAMVFFLGGLMLVDRAPSSGSLRRAGAAGLALGFAVLTKMIMVIAVAAVLAVIALGWLVLRRFSWRQLAAVVAGMVTPLLAFELVKLAVLGVAGWRTWWDVMVGRMLGQGLPGDAQELPGGAQELPVSAEKAVQHLQILRDIAGLDGWLPVLVLVVPTLLLVFLVLVKGRERRHEISLSVVSLWASAGFFLGWWLILTPTSRAWLRRAIDGLILQEILTVIVVFWGIGWIQGKVRVGDLRTVVGRLQVFFAGALVAALVLGLGVALAGTLSGIAPLTSPAEEKVENETIAAAIRELPDDAELFGVGWFQAPVLAVLSGRSFLDFEEFEIDRYRERLDRSYLVVDNHVAFYQPSQIESALARTEYETVARAGPCALHRLHRVLPYPPIPEPKTESEVAETCAPELVSYPFSGGLESESPFGRSHAVSGFVLDNEDKQCLAVGLWVSPRSGRRPRLEVRIDDQVVLEQWLAGDEASRHMIAFDDIVQVTDAPRLVELWMYRDGARPQWALWYSDKDLYVVKEVGFVDCPPAELSPDLGPR